MTAFKYDFIDHAGIYPKTHVYSRNQAVKLKKHNPDQLLEILR